MRDRVSLSYLISYGSPAFPTFLWKLSEKALIQVQSPIWFEVPFCHQMQLTKWNTDFSSFNLLIFFSGKKQYNSLNLTKHKLGFPFIRRNLNTRKLHCLILIVLKCAFKKQKNATFDE